MRRRRALIAAACALAAVLPAACTGGGGDEPAAGVVPVAADVGMPPPGGAGADVSAGQAVAALGTPGAVDAVTRGRGLQGMEEFGGVRDAFEPLVKPPREDPAPAAADADPAPATVPTMPSIPTPPPAPVALPAPAAPVPVAPTPASAPTAPDEPADAADGDDAGDPGDRDGRGGPELGETSPWRAADTRVVGPSDGSRPALTADLEFAGEVVAARRGDAVPPGTQQFTVVEITRTQVVLRLTGGLLPDGGDTLTLALGDEVALQDARTGRVERLTLIGIRAR